MQKIKNISSWRKMSLALWKGVEAYRYMYVELDVTSVNYAEYKSRGVSWTHLIVRWLSASAARLPDLNRHVINNTFYQKKEIDIFLRMSFEEKDVLWGCYFRKCEDKTLVGIRDHLNKVRGDALARLKTKTSLQKIIDMTPVCLIRFALKMTKFRVIRKLVPDYLSPTISLSNPGSLGMPPLGPLPSFVLSSPVIISLGSLIKRDEKLILPLNIGFDHRVVDGNLAAKFIKELHVELRA